MNSGKPAVAANLYEWLPECGENEVSARSEGLDWVVEILYDDITGDAQRKRELRFTNVCCTYQATFPGPAMLAIALETGQTLSALVEYPDSEAALAWRAHFGNARPIKHYRLLFLSANSMIQVFAEGFTLAEPAELK